MRYALYTYDPPDGDGYSVVGVESPETERHLRETCDGLNELRAAIRDLELRGYSRDCLEWRRFDDESKYVTWTQGTTPDRSEPLTSATGDGEERWPLFKGLSA